MSNNIQSPIKSTIAERHTSRKYKHYGIEFDELLYLLQYSYGVVREGEHRGKQAYFRAVPSGGGRYPLEIYVVVANGAGFDEGIYHFNPIDNELSVLYGPETAKHVISSSEYWMYPDVTSGASIAIIMTAVFERTVSKYSDRGYRYVLIEAGHVAQNICLISQDLGLSSCCMAGYYDRPIEKLLGIDGVSESVVYSVMVGKPENGH